MTEEQLNEIKKYMTQSEKEACELEYKAVLEGLNTPPEERMKKYKNLI